jgi:hypothetical protein
VLLKSVISLLALFIEFSFSGLAASEAGHNVVNGLSHGEF